MGVGISTGAVHSILVDELKDSEICSRWIPHSLTKDQKDGWVTCVRKLLSEFEDSIQEGWNKSLLVTRLDKIRRITIQRKK